LRHVGDFLLDLISFFKSALKVNSTCTCVVLVVLTEMTISLRTRGLILGIVLLVEACSLRVDRL
jgi:hypothetical protein